VLTTSPLTFNANPGFYSLTVQNVKDLFGNTIATASTAIGLYPNAVLWIRANTGVTTGTDPGHPDPTTNTVSMWLDISGNNNTFFGGGDVTTQPIIATNAWGDPVIRFNTNDAYSNFLATAQNSTTAGVTGDMSIIAVLNVRSLTAHPAEIVSKTGGANKNIPAPYDYYLGSTGAPLYRGDGGGGGAGVDYGNFTSTQVPVLGYPCIMAVSQQGSIISHYLDSQAVGTGILGSSFPLSKIFDLQQQVYVGSRSDNVNRLAGDLAELIVAASPMSSGDIAALGNYLSAQHHFVLFNPNPTNLVASSSNNQLTFSWPTDHTGWQLQSNAVGLRATNSWFPVSGATLTNKITITPDTNQANVYYRLFFQQP
jgi:hypothetical protein